LAGGQSAAMASSSGSNTTREDNGCFITTPEILAQRVGQMLSNPCVVNKYFKLMTGLVRGYAGAFRIAGS
jgi:hypothetical protein